MMKKASGSDPMKSKEAGSTLLLAMVVLLGLSLAAITAMYLARTDTQISGNLAYRNAASEATNVALQTAGAQIEAAMAPNNQLLEYQNPASLAPWYYSSPAKISNMKAYWQNCDSNNAPVGSRCASISVGSNTTAYKFKVKYFVQPTGSVDMNPNGSDQFYAVYYRVYAHAENQNGGSTAADVEATYRHYVPKRS